MIARRWPITGAGLVLLLTVLVGCSVAQAPATLKSPPPPTESPSIAGDPSEGPADCQTWTLQRSPETPTIENLSKLAPTVVVATFTGYGEPFWDTPDGRRPSSDVVRAGDAEIFTPVDADVSAAVKGPREPATNAVVWGGTIGCDRFTTNQNPVLTVGSKYVMFLLPRTRKGVETGDAWLVAAWEIGPGDEVSTPIDGPRSLGQLTSEIQAGKVAPTQTPGAEPTSGFP